MKGDVVQMLVGLGSVEKLTNIKLELCEMCRKVEDFPQGEFYLRQKLKGGSMFSCLEERLGDDIFELMKCLDTETITPEIRAMFKPTSSTLSDNQGENQSVVSELLVNGRVSSQSPLVRETGWSGVKAQIVSLQSGYLLFREKTERNIVELGNKLSNLNKVIESQEKEINYLKEENKQLRDLCINHTSSSSLRPMGPNKTNCNGDTGPSRNKVSKDTSRGNWYTGECHLGRLSRMSRRRYPTKYG